MSGRPHSRVVGPVLDASDIVPFDTTDTTPQIVPHVELTAADVDELIQAWQIDFDERLTVEEARSEALRLLHFFGTLEDVLRLEGEHPGEVHQP